MKTVVTLFSYLRNMVILLRTNVSFIGTLSSRVIGRVSFGKDVFLSGSYINGDVKIGSNCKIYKVDISGEVSIGTSIYGTGTAIHAKINNIKIGAYCSIAKNVQIMGYNHDLHKTSTYYMHLNIFKDGVADVVSDGSVIIGNDVWIGANTVILSNVNIGNGAVMRCD